jgi:hypothetical protein
LAKKTSSTKNDDVVVASTDITRSARDLIGAADAMIALKMGPTDRFLNALERLRVALPPLPPPPPPPPRERATPQDWDARVMEWALSVATITLDRALRHFAVGLGSEEQREIDAALQRLPKERFAISWYPASSGSLAPKWTKVVLSSP